MRVRVYWNLHKKKFSIQHKGRVIGHADVIALADVVFHVNESGRQRVLRERKKYVHAYVVGDIVDYATDVREVYDKQELVNLGARIIPCSKLIKYNPYKSGYFNDGMNSYTAADAVFMMKSSETKTPFTYAQGVR